MQLAPETKRLIDALPDEGLRRVIAQPNERFGKYFAGPCLFTVAAGNAQEAVRLADTCFPRGSGHVTPSCILYWGWDSQLSEAEHTGQRDAFLNEVKAACAETLARRDLAPVTDIDVPRGAVVGERVEA